MSNTRIDPDTPLLPEFDNPPVVEVALSAQFKKLDSLHSPQLGYIWQTFNNRFPKTEEQPLLEPVFEQFGTRAAGRPGVRLMVTQIPQVRVWFQNDSGTELLQVQQDRFVRNWRKQEDSDEYPRYTKLRDLFRSDFNAFCCLIESQKWGTVEPNQCEITYVNIIPVEQCWDGHGDLGQLLTIFQSRYSDDSLEKPEEAAVTVQYVMKSHDNEPVGRLHIAANPVSRVPDDQPAIRLTLTARGKPQGEDIDGVMRFFDQGHDTIVRGFAAITTKAMHEVWRRTS